jgi:asparagine synthase (glutamine-hydrolysing)
VPYLDHRVIEYAATLPPRYKIRVLTEKYILRRALSGLLPESILKRVKQPYRAPDSQTSSNSECPSTMLLNCWVVTA